MKDWSEIEFRSRAEAEEMADFFVDLSIPVADRRQLSRLLAERLSFPRSAKSQDLDWQDLGGLLEDLSWLKEVYPDLRTVVLFHSVVPSLPARQLALYLSVLETAMAWRNEDGPPYFVAVFDRDLKDELEAKVVDRG